MDTLICVDGLCTNENCHATKSRFNVRVVLSFNKNRPWFGESPNFYHFPHTSCSMTDICFNDLLTEHRFKND